MIVFTCDFSSGQLRGETVQRSFEGNTTKILSIGKYANIKDRWSSRMLMHHVHRAPGLKSQPYPGYQGDAEAAVPVEKTITQNQFVSMTL